MIHYNHSELNILSTMEMYNLSREDSISLLDTLIEMDNARIFQHMRDDDYADSEGDFES